MSSTYPRSAPHWTLVACLVLAESSCRSKDRSPPPKTEPAPRVEEAVAPARPRLVEGTLAFSPQSSAKFTLELSPPGPNAEPATATVKLEGAITAFGKGPLYEGQVRVPLEGSAETRGRGYFVTTELEPHVSAHVQFWDATTGKSW